jgi:hypothetical protein
VRLKPPSAGRASSPGLEAEAAQAFEAKPPTASPKPPATVEKPERPEPAAAAGPSAAERAEQKREQVARAAARGELGEPRVREIYKEFIEAKRRSNESTASITYDKLADSLRKQVDKLKKEHTDRRIDFAVVTKDGKTMIKPIIK